MSFLIPRETIDILRSYVNLTLSFTGIDATLYVPTAASLAAIEGADVYQKPGDLTYLSYSTKVFMFWNLNKYRMRKIGIYTEESLPIIIGIPYKATALEGSEAGTEVDVDVVQESYIRISPEFVPGDITDVAEFELVDIPVKGMQEAVIVKLFKGVPRRIKL